MTETSDSGNYSQYEDRSSSENTSETCKQSNINPYHISSDLSDDDSDYDGSDKVDQTSVYTWVINGILLISIF